MSIKVFSASLCAATLVLATGVFANEAFQSATSVSAVKKAGGQQITGKSILQIVNNKTLTNPGWTWTFKPDGTQSSKANDGSWSTKGVWDVRGNQLCRTSDDGKERCSNVYFLGRDLKFSDPNSKTKVSDWYVSF